MKNNDDDRRDDDDDRDFMTDDDRGSINPWNDDETRAIEDHDWDK